MITEFSNLQENKDNEAMQPFVKGLKKGSDDLQAATMWMMQNGLAKPDNAGAGSHDYMHLFGLVILGYMWGLMAKVAATKQDDEFMKNKLITARFYFDRMMPESAAHLARIQTGSDSMMALAANDF